MDEDKNDGLMICILYIVTITMVEQGSYFWFLISRLVGKLGMAVVDIWGENWPCYN